jgi:hypothetical protein
VNTSGQHFATIEMFLYKTSSHYTVVQCSVERSLGNKLLCKCSKICGGLCTNHLGKVELWLVFVQSHFCMKFVVYTSVFSNTARHTKKLCCLQGD